MAKERYDIEPNGCLSCTFWGCKKETGEGGFLQAGYTWQDEYGHCPPEANKEVEDILDKLNNNNGRKIIQV